MMLSLLGFSAAVILPAIYLHSKAQSGKRCIQLPAEGPNQSEIRRSHLSPELLTTPESDVQTLYQVLVKATCMFPQKDQWGQRTFIKTITEERQVTKTVAGEQVKEVKKWNFSEMSPYSYLTYSDINTLVHQIGSGLKFMGVSDKLSIFASTSREWSLMAYSCWAQNITITTAYDTLGPEGLAFSLNEGEVDILFTNSELFSTVRKVIPLVGSLKNIVYFGVDRGVEEIKSDFPAIKFYSLEEVKALGIQHQSDPKPPKPEDTACIMYTSGSTGNPKGVIISHANIISAISGASRIVEGYLNESDVYLAYLPLAHILEMIIECYCFYRGVTIGYGSPRTLSDTSVRNCNGDMKELRPTVMAGVPSVWETIRKGVLTKVGSASAGKQRIFKAALNLKINLMQMGLPSSFLDFAFKLIKQNTGGRLRFAISGGAPIPKETHQFLAATLCPILQGYGMTETSGIIAIQHPDQAFHCILGQVGPPSPSVEVKLIDVPDMNYLCTNTPHPQGELYVRGASISKGYYKQEKVTKETFTSDGWLMTGDIAEFHPDGSIAIIDRKKNLVKLSNGEYIALEKLEAIYKTSPFVQNLCVYADPMKGYPVAVVCPLFVDVLKLAIRKKWIPAEEHVENLDIAKIENCRKEILRVMLETAAKAGFKTSEKLGGIVLSQDEWTPQNGFLTAAMKINRIQVIKTFKDEIDALYV